MDRPTIERRQVWIYLVAIVGWALRTGEKLPAALVLIGLPLAAAALTERWVEARPQWIVWRERLG